VVPEWQCVNKLHLVRVVVLLEWSLSGSVWSLSGSV